jgi:hypothetical protein
MKKITLLRVAEWIIIIPLAYYAFQYSQLKTDDHIRNVIDVPHSPIVHVDKNYSGELQNGSSKYPFTKISQAIEFCDSNEPFDTILVGPGQYNESLEISKRTNIIGTGGTPTIKDPEPDTGKTVLAKDDVLLANINLQAGNYGLYINPDVDVILFRVEVSRADKWGIFNEHHQTTDSAKLSLINSKVSNSRRQGLYLQRGTFYMNNSIADQNGEEGVDLHVEMKTIIKNSTISNNGEGGLETELGNINLQIQNSIFENNGSSGINIQSFEADSNVALKDNTIKNNRDFGVRCARHSKFKSPYFSKMVQFEGGNVFEGNGKEKIDPTCFKR